MSAIAIGVLALVLATRILHLAPIAVRSGSMSPTLPVNTLLLTEQVDPAVIRIGDVITFDPPGPAPRTTHRVIARTQRGDRWYFRTKGDANDAPDDWRRAADHDDPLRSGVTYGSQPAVRMRYHVPQLGRLADLTAHDRTRHAMFYVPLAVLTLNALLVIWLPRRRRPALQVP